MSGARERSFEEQAAGVAARLRADVAAVIAALPERVSGGTDLDRQLKLGSTISWRLHSFATSANPVAALEQLPGRGTIERLVKAAQRKGVSEALSERVLHSFDQFEAFMQEHAGDRATLASMVSGVASDGGAGMQSRRRAAFRVNADLWGIQARALVRCTIVHPGGEPGVEDIVLIKGCIEAQSLRRGVTLRLTQQTSIFTDSEVNRPLLERTVPATDIGLLTEFSSKPLPELTTALDPAGLMRVTKFRALGVGKSSAVSFYTREHARVTSAQEATTDWRGDSLISMPAETFIRNLLVPRGWADPTTVSVSTFGNLTRTADAYDRNEEDRLPITESAVYLGTDLASLQTPEVPRYPELVAHVLQEHGWQDTQFDIFHCRVQYPILQSMISVQVEAWKK